MQQIKHASFLAFLVLFFASCATTQQKTSTADLLFQAESTITAGMETLKTAIDLGRVDINSAGYAAVYQGLEVANELMAQAWTAYRGGDDVGADSARQLALSSYMQIRPLLVDMAGGEQ
ncbi:MAG: hypothetical protein KJN90_10590 [Gammaproteobacteria bacterium]|nr:hypothetical protein [Gammaproteobacteria bacterium]MBT8438692.1 hypothetical protein [Gammaproteobacteria bacterium]NNK57417.1 hypothetical protein [Desulfofustis sp.]